MKIISRISNDQNRINSIESIYSNAIKFLYYYHLFFHFKVAVLKNNLIPYPLNRRFTGLNKFRNWVPFRIGQCIIETLFQIGFSRLNKRWHIRRQCRRWRWFMRRRRRRSWGWRCWRIQWSKWLWHARDVNSRSLICNCGERKRSNRKRD